MVFSNFVVFRTYIVLAVFEFRDVKLKRKATLVRTNLNNVIYPGLTYLLNVFILLIYFFEFYTCRGVCRNVECIAYEKNVNSWFGFGEFNLGIHLRWSQKTVVTLLVDKDLSLTKENIAIKCPFQNCSTPFSVDKLIIHDTRATVTYHKIISLLSILI
jgi:hypothetical protein